ncbi:MAG: micrococcal nuclease [Solirubrobacterales bacterium]|jgi:micrococcal nuclease|nr:micrococcal nuclease [Solirubrobacterales bacterium]
MPVSRLPSLVSVAILVILVVVLVTTGDDEQTTSEARITRVVDGDTVEASIDGRTEDVRYIGVDTPESVKPDTPVQCYALPASHFNERLVEGKTVRLEYDAERRDVYGRLLAYVYLGDRFVNAELVRRGFARTLTIPPNTRFADRFARLERDASDDERGLWGRC